MSNNLKCPFCGAELENDLTLWDGPTNFFFCPNKQCQNHDQCSHKDLWKLAIDGKKAQDALKIAIQELNSLIEPVNNQDDYRNSVLTQFGLNRAINEIKRKITSITKQADNE